MFLCRKGPSNRYLLDISLFFLLLILLGKFLLFLLLYSIFYDASRTMPHALDGGPRQVGRSDRHIKGGSKAAKRNKEERRSQPHAAINIVITLNLSTYMCVCV